MSKEKYIFTAFEDFGINLLHFNCVLLLLIIRGISLLHSDCVLVLLIICGIGLLHSNCVSLGFIGASLPVTPHVCCIM